MQQFATTEHIDGQLAALENALADFEAEAERLSLGAVSGDKKSVDALATVHAKIAQASTDRSVLTSARAAAAKIENAATDAEAQAERAAAMKQAREIAGQIQRAAKRVDQLVEEFRAIVIDLPALEQSLHAKLRQAGQPANDGIIGRRGMAGIAITAMAAADKAASFRPRSTGDFSAVAWDYLTNAEAGDE